MTEEEIAFCESTTLAARRIGFKISELQQDGKTRFVWYDLATGSIVPCRPMDSRKDALHEACKEIVNYLNQ